jgi:hypothetical protein
MRGPIRKGKLGKPTEFGYVAQIGEETENTRKGARRFFMPAGNAPAKACESRLLPGPSRTRPRPTGRGRVSPQHLSRGK